MKNNNLKFILSPIYHALIYPKKAMWYRKIMADPKKYISEIYYAMNQRDLNWEHPTDLNEVLNWLKLYGDTSQWPLYADKFRVREYVKSKGLEDMLIPLIGKYDHVWQIPWDKLPEQFVLKPNNGSNNVIVCNDKKSLNKIKVFSHCIIQEHRKYGYANYEPHYMQIKPCIIIEKLMDVSKQSVPSSSLIDYKIYCVNGEPEYIWVVTNRTSTTCETTLYDLDWKQHNEYCVETAHYRIANGSIPKPQSLNKMIDAARRLANGIPFIRIDLYEIDGKPYFGEMTMAPAGGFISFHTDEFLKILGTKIVLPRKE